MDLQEVSSNSTSVKPPRKKPGPKPKPLQERKYKPRGPVLRKKETHSPAKRLRVLMYLYHHKILDNTSPKPRSRPGAPPPIPAENGYYYRPPTFVEASEYFHIPQQTLSTWWNSRDKYLPLDKAEEGVASSAVTNDGNGSSQAQTQAQTQSGSPQTQSGSPQTQSGSPQTQSG